MANATQSRKVVKPVCGVCKWIRRIGETGPKSGLLEINGTTYGVIVIDGGYQLVKADGTTYEVDAEWWVCSCPDATWRNRECKHVKSLKAALAVLTK